MQVKYSPFIFFKPNVDSKIGFSSTTMPANTNIQDRFISNSAAKPTFGAKSNLYDLAATKPGCNFNKDKNTLEFGLLSKNAGRLELWIYKKPFTEAGNKRNYSEAARIPMEKINDKWATFLSKEELQKQGIDLNKDAVYYGYRVWGKEGSNWEYNKNWRPGSANGFNSHVDAEGNRFNPNKLLTDPEATEVSHDPVTAGINEDGTVYSTGSDTYKIDTAPFAPKSIFVMQNDEKIETLAPKPVRPLSSDNMYETHVKGLTAKHTKETLLNCYEVLKEENKNKPEKLAEIEQMQAKIKAPVEKGGWDNKYAGTFKGAGYMALYLKLLGFTSVEFLPLQEFQNSEKDHFEKNYWGYMTLSYKAPERNYAFDKAPGGPTKEFKEMVNEFHKQDVKVCMDVVYNHTAEGNCYGQNTDKANLLNLRGIDNTSYYETASDKKHYYDSNGCGANLNAANPIAQQLTVDTLKYWKNQMNVDSFRFDLASVLGNTRAMEHDFYFDSSHKDSLLQKIETLGPRSKKIGQGVDLIAEPWACGDGTYQVGNFSANYSEWNGPARDTLRKSINKLGCEDTPPLDLIRFFSGSYDTFKKKNPKTVNFIDCHDGYTMHDLFAYNKTRTLEQGSEGGTDNKGNISWDQGGDVNLRKQAVRTAQTLLAVATGTPMIQGGDERYRTTLGNNNTWNIDGALNYINWGNPTHEKELNGLRKASKLKFPVKCDFRDEDKTYQMTQQETNDLTKFTSRLFNFRKNHPALRPIKYFDGKDHNNLNGKDIMWLDKAGKEMIGATEQGRNYMLNPQEHITAFRIDGTEFKDSVTAKKESATAIYVAYNKGAKSETIKLPDHQLPDKEWFMVADTSCCPNDALSHENMKREGEEVPISDDKINCNSRSAVILIEKDKISA